MTSKEFDRFQCWLMEMDVALEKFVSLDRGRYRNELDFGSKSLGVLENLILAKYKSIKEIKGDGEFLDGASRYFGETIRVATGAKWEIRLDDKKFVFYGIPIIYGGKINSVPICPLTSITACVDRRTGVFLTKIYENLTKTEDVVAKEKELLDDVISQAYASDLVKKQSKNDG